MIIMAFDLQHPLYRALHSIISAETGINLFDINSKNEKTRSKTTKSHFTGAYWPDTICPGKCKSYKITPHKNSGLNTYCSCGVTVWYTRKIKKAKWGKSGFYLFV